MSDLCWTHLKASAASSLTEACPSLAKQQATLAALSAVVALAKVALFAQPVVGSLTPKLTATPAVASDPLAVELLDLIARLVEDHVTRPMPDVSPAFGDWVLQHGFHELSLSQAARNAGGLELKAVAAIVAPAIRALTERSMEISRSHMKDIVARDLQQLDLPEGLAEGRSLPQGAIWLLAPESSGQPHRAETLKRRRQAMSLYGALSSSLYSPDVTKAIDEGAPLAPMLRHRHGLSAAELRALRDARRPLESVEAGTDFKLAVEELKAHGIPLHEWPGGGRSGQHEAWGRSIWNKGRRHHVLRPDYLGDNPQGVEDAIEAFRADLLRPLIADRIRVCGLAVNHHVQSFACSGELGNAGVGREVRRRLLAALSRAIIGARRPKAFHEAVGLWHRRVASLAALRHERQADRPGWPPLCSPWRSACGRFEIVALASATDLVEEGSALDHCVGGYYEICRRGNTQILSLREESRRVATVELILGDEVDAIVLEVGQFKARRNTSPAPHLHDALRSFLRAVRNGAHAVEAARIVRYRKRMRDTWDGAWRSDALTLAHAREVFPFYLPLLPRETPNDFDGWSRETGLNAAIDAVLIELTADPREDRGRHTPLSATQESDHASL